MNNKLKWYMLPVIALSPLAFGQATPAASAPSTSSGPAFSMVQPSGTLNYTIGASDTVVNGYNGGGAVNTANVFGRVSLVTGSESRPTSLLYSGGYIFSNADGIPSSAFHNLGLSQVIQTKNWHFVLSDLVSYLPTSPTTGFSGIAGAGDIGSPTNPGTGIISYYSTRVLNLASGSVDRTITSKTLISGSASYGVQRFLSGVGIDNTQVTGTVGPTHRIDDRNEIGGNYTYSRFSYGPSSIYAPKGFTFIAHGANLSYRHAFSPRMTADVSVGPQWTTSTDTVYSPSRLSFAANMALTYVSRMSRASLVYYRGTNAGSGVLVGAVSDNIGLVLQRDLDRNWNVGLSATYGRTSGLQTGLLQAKSDTVYGGIQLNRKIGRDFSAYGSYNAQNQSINNVPGFQNAFSGFSQVFGIGLTYSPQSIRIGRR